MKQNLDVFTLRDHGLTLAEYARSLGADMQPEMAPQEEAQRQFEWSPKGVGIYVANNIQEQQAWLQRLSDWSDGGVMCLSPTEMMNVKNILPPTPEERLIKDVFRRLGVLSRKDSAADIVGVMGMMQEARFDPQETDVFIVQCPDVYTSEKFRDIAAFDRACLAGNVLAADARKNSYDELMCEMNWDKKHVRHLSQRLDRFVRGQMENFADHEAILAALRHEGQQVSQDLAGALEYRYYQLLRDFIDVGSVYRHLPDNTKVALIVDRDTLIDLASGYKFGYSSVQEAKDLGLGVYGFRTEPVADMLEQMKRLQEQVWGGDPAREMIRAGLLHAEYKLPEAPIEHC